MTLMRKEGQKNLRSHKREKVLLWTLSSSQKLDFNDKAEIAYRDCAEISKDTSKDSVRDHFCFLLCSQHVSSPLLFQATHGNRDGSTCYLGTSLGILSLINNLRLDLEESVRTILSERKRKAFRYTSCKYWQLPRGERC